MSSFREAGKPERKGFGQRSACREGVCVCDGISSVSRTTMADLERSPVFLAGPHADHSISTRILQASAAGLGAGGWS